MHGQRRATATRRRGASPLVPPPRTSCPSRESPPPPRLCVLTPKPVRVAPLHTHCQLCATADDWQLLECHTGEPSSDAAPLREWRKRMQMRACHGHQWGDVVVRSSDGLCAPLHKEPATLSQLLEGLSSGDEEAEEAPPSPTSSQEEHATAFDALPSPPPGILQAQLPVPPCPARPPAIRVSDLPKVPTQGGAFLDAYQPSLDSSAQLFAARCAEALVATDHAVARMLQQRRAHVAPALLARLKQELVHNLMAREARLLVRQGLMHAVDEHMATAAQEHPAVSAAYVAPTSDAQPDALVRL